MTTTTAPTPHAEPSSRSVGKSLDFEWPVHEWTNDRGENCTTIVQLSVSHYGRSEIAGRPEYMYVATLSIVTDRKIARDPRDGDGEGFYTMRSMRFGISRAEPGGLIHRQNNVRRRGAKSMRIFADEALTLVRQGFDSGNETVINCFQPWELG